MNLYRRYFAASRYDRVMIQKHLIKSAYDGSQNLKDHMIKISLTISIVKEYDLLDEFIEAAKEEEQGIQRIIEAYDKRKMNQPLS